MSDRSSRRDDSRIEAMAIPFVVGMAFGIALGRSLFGSTLVGVGIGLCCFGLLYWLRLRYLPLR
ncbi:hypothetical protein ACNS7O_10585 [Haloferacaceae archaeon DSL9]